MELFTQVAQKIWKKEFGSTTIGIGANYTKTRLPVDLVYYEEYIRIDEAFYPEKQIQGWSRKKKLALIDGKPELLPKMAKKNFKK